LPYTAVFALLLYKYVFFTAPALLLRFTFFCVGISIGNLPETRYFLLAFYRYFRVILDSVTFLRPWWQPWVCCESHEQCIGCIAHICVEHAVMLLCFTFMVRNLNPCFCMLCPPFYISLFGKWSLEIATRIKCIALCWLIFALFNHVKRGQ